jgi:hypothetical protein
VVAGGILPHDAAEHSADRKHVLAKPEEFDAYNKRVTELDYQLRQQERELLLLEQEDKRKIDGIHAQWCENAKVLKELKVKSEELTEFAKILDKVLTLEDGFFGSSLYHAAKTTLGRYWTVN